MDDTGSCCSPRREHTAGAQPGHTDRVAALGLPAVPPAGRPRHGVEQVDVPGGTFAMGDAFGDGYPGDGEGPVHEVTVSPYRIDATSVTNADFAGFTRATGYQTEAERFGFSAVFHLAVRARPQHVMGPAPGAPWW